MKIKEARFAPRLSHNRKIRDDAVRVDRLDDGTEFWAAYSPLRQIFQEERAAIGDLFPTIREFMDPDALNGYVFFPKRKAPKIPRTYRGIAQYVPVHGGLTYALKDAFGAVWGFDTAHHNSTDVPRSDPDWIIGQCQIVLVALRKAEELYPRYRRASQAERLEIGQAIMDVAHLGTGPVIFDVLNPITILGLTAGNA